MRRWTRNRAILVEENYLLPGFWDRVAKLGPDDCWYWQAGRTSDGYGVFKLRTYFRVSTHRIAWALHNQTEPGAGYVCHSCDHPLCCNPAHLFLGNAKINAIDKVKKGRARGRYSASKVGPAPDGHRANSKA